MSRVEGKLPRVEGKMSRPSKISAIYLSSFIFHYLLHFLVIIYFLYEWVRKISRISRL